MKWLIGTVAFLFLLCVGQAEQVSVGSKHLTHFEATCHSLNLIFLTVVVTESWYFIFLGQVLIQFLKDFCIRVVIKSLFLYSVKMKRKEHYF